MKMCVVLFPAGLLVMAEAIESRETRRGADGFDGPMAT
jgi:hypothetical protein